MKRCLIVSIVFLMCASVMPAQTKPLDVLKKMGATYSKMDKMSCKFTLNIPTGMGAMTIPTDMKMQRPNKFRMEVADGQALTAVSDGENMYMYVPPRNAYQKTKAPTAVDFRGASSGPMGDLSTQGDLMGTLMKPDNEEALAALAKTATMLDDSTAAGLLCHHMRIEMVTGVKAELWIDKEQYLLRKLQMDMAELVKAMSDSMGAQGAEALAMFGKLKPAEMMLVQEYDKYDLAPKFAEDTFKFTPPAGAKEVDFAKLMQEMGAGGAPKSASGEAGGAVKPTRKAPASY